MNDEIIKTGLTKHRFLIPKKMTMRQCLLAMGLSDAQIRYRKGCRSILENWIGEIDEFSEMVMFRWKRLSVLHHESNGGDKDEWAKLNALYSRIKKGISSFKGGTEGAAQFFSYRCKICKKKRVRKLSNKPAIARKMMMTERCHDNEECKKAMSRIRCQKNKEKNRIYIRKVCKRSECNNEFVTSKNFQTFCSKKCWHKDLYKRRKVKKLEQEQAQKIVSVGSRDLATQSA